LSEERGSVSRSRKKEKGVKRKEEPPRKRKRGIGDYLSQESNQMKKKTSLPRLPGEGRVKGKREKISSRREKKKRHPRK